MRNFSFIPINWGSIFGAAKEWVYEKKSYEKTTAIIYQIETLVYEYSALLKQLKAILA